MSSTLCPQFHPLPLPPLLGHPLFLPSYSHPPLPQESQNLCATPPIAQTTEEAIEPVCTRKQLRLDLRISEEPFRVHHVFEMSSLFHEHDVSSCILCGAVSNAILVTLIHFRALQHFFWWLSATAFWSFCLRSYQDRILLITSHFPLGPQGKLESDILCVKPVSN